MAEERQQVGARPGEEPSGTGRWGWGKKYTRGAEEASLEHPLHPDAPFSAISVEGILSHSHISINEFITNCAKMHKEQ